MEGNVSAVSVEDRIKRLERSLMGAIALITGELASQGPEAVAAVTSQLGADLQAMANER